MSNSSPVFSQYKKQDSINVSNLGILKDKEQENVSFKSYGNYTYGNAYRNNIDIQRGIDEKLYYPLPSFQEIIEDPSFNTKEIDVTASINGKLSNTLRSAYQSADSIDSLKSWEMASIVADIANVDIGYAHDNMADLIGVVTGRDIENEGGVGGFFTGLGKSALSKVTSSWAGIRAKMLNASIAGKTEKERQLAIDYFVNNELPQLSTYWNPDMYGFRDNVGGKLLYFMAENSPDIVESFLTGIITGGIGSVAKLSTKAVNVLDKLIRVASIYEKESGSALVGFYQTYNANGQRMDYETMALYSSIIGLVNTGFEFGLEKALGAMGVKTMQRLSSATNLFKKYGKVSSKTVLETGIETAGEYIKKGLVSNLKNATGEGLTEAMQSWSELFFSNLAYKVSDGFGDQVKSSKEILKEMAEMFAYTAVSTFLQAPVIGADPDGFSFLGYSRDMRNGKIVKLEQATKYSNKTDNSTLVSMNNISTRGKVYNQNTTSNTGEVVSQNINVYKIGENYVPATQADYQAVNNALGNTAGIYVNVLNDTNVTGSPINVDSRQSMVDYGINTKKVTGFAENTVIVPSKDIESFTLDVMANNDVVSAVFTKDGQQTNSGDFDNVTLSVKNNDGDVVNFKIITEENAKANNIEVADFDTADVKNDAKIKTENIEREAGVVKERVKQANKTFRTEADVNKVFDNNNATLNKTEKRQVKNFRNYIYNSIVANKEQKGYKGVTARAIANINTTLLQTFARINKTDFATYVKDNLGVDVNNLKNDATVKPFINLMTEADVMNNNSPAFIQQNTDGTWTINLYAGANTQANLTHEFGHMFLSTIKDDSVLDEFKTLYKDEFERGGITGKEFQERFCVDLENYIASGEARNEGLRAIFEQIVKAMTSFVDYVRGLSFENKDEVIQAFDNLFQEGTVENIQRVQESKNTINSIKDTLGKVVGKFEGNDTIERLSSDVNNTIDLLNDQTIEDKSTIWQDFLGYASDLREEITSVIADTDLSKDEDVTALIETLSDTSLVKLMNNRPFSSLMYRKENSGLENGNGELTTKTPNRNDVISRLTDKRFYNQDTKNDKVFVHNERLATSKKNKEETKKLQKELKGARAVASHYNAEVFLISNADGEKLFISKNSPDGIANGYFLELKTTSSDNVNTIRNRIRKASKQGEILYLNFVENSVSMEEINKAISQQYKDSHKTMEGMGVIIAKNDEIVSDGIIKNGVLEEGLHFDGLREVPQSEYRITQNQLHVNQSQKEFSATDNDGSFDTSDPNIYTKNVEYTYAQGSVLVPYTTEQIIGRIRQGKPVEASHLQTLLDSNKDNASFNKSYRAIIQKELSAIRILTANPVLNRTILEEYSKLDSTKGINTETLYQNVLAKMKDIDSSFTFGTKREGKALIERAIAHASWETTETRNQNFLAQNQTKEQINELALSLSKNGYLSNELKYFPLESLRRLALNLEYGYGKITDKTYENIKKELADPMYTTAIRLASNNAISYEDVNNVYHSSTVDINSEDFANTLHNSALPEEWRNALKTGAYNDTLLEEMNKYVVKQKVQERLADEAITDLSEREKQLNKDISTLERMYTSDVNSAYKTIAKYQSTVDRLNTKLAELKADYANKKIEAKEYERSAKKLERALENANSTYAIMQAKIAKEKVVRGMANVSALNRKSQDHSTGRRMEALYYDLNTSQREINNAMVWGYDIKPTADIKDIQRDFPAMVSWLQDKGLIDSQGNIIGNIQSLSLEDTKELLQLFKSYRKIARDVLVNREKVKTAKAIYDAFEVQRDIRINNKWTLTEEGQAEVDKKVEEQIKVREEFGIVTSEDDIARIRDEIRLGATLGKARQDARPANAEFNKTLKESPVKTTTRLFDIPRNVLRKISPSLERIIMGGYDADGNETIGIEQLTDKEESGIRTRSEGFTNKVIELFNEKLKKKDKVSKYDMYNIFSTDKSVLQDSKIKIFDLKETDEGGLKYFKTEAFAELINQASQEEKKMLETIYKVAVLQDQTDFDSGAEHYNYTLEEKMGIYLMLKQEGYAYALWRGNNLSASRMLGLYQEFTSADKESNIGKAKQLADYIQKDAESRYPEINPISINLDNKDLSDIKVTDYFGIFYDLSPSYDGLTISLDSDSPRVSSFSLADGFLHDREGGTKALRLDVISTWAKQVQRQEHYIAFAEYFDHLKRMLNKEGLFNDIKLQNGEKTAKWVNDFLRNIAKSNSSLAGVDETVGSVFKSMRSTLAKSALSWNVAPVLSQVSTLTYAISEGISLNHLFSAMKEVIAHPIQTAQLVRSMSEQMQSQKRLDVALAKTDNIDLTTTKGKAKYYIDVFAETGMKPLEMFDTGVKNILWLAKYKQQVEYYNNLAQGTTGEAKSIANHIEKNSDYVQKRAVFDANVFVLDSQQSTLAKNNPVIYSTGNDLVRSILMFNSQSTKQAFWHLNNLTDSQKGETIIRITNNLIGYSMAIALTCAIGGRIERKEDEEWEDWLLRVTQEFGSEMLTEVPVIGQLVSQYDNGGNSTVQIPLANVAQQGYNLFTSLTEEEKANGKTRWEKSATALKNLAFEFGSFSGIPTAQLKKFYNAISERNWLYVLGYDWGQLGDSWFE